MMQIKRERKKERESSITKIHHNAYTYKLFLLMHTCMRIILDWQSSPVRFERSQLVYRDFSFVFHFFHDVFFLSFSLSLSLSSRSFSDSQMHATLFISK